LIISNLQMEQMQTSRLESFNNSLEINLKSKYPYETSKVSEPELRRLIDVGLTRADEYHLEDKVNIERFVIYIVRYGNEFGIEGDTSWARNLLTDDGFTPTEKMDEIDRRWLSNQGETDYGR